MTILCLISKPSLLTKTRNMLSKIVWRKQHTFWNFCLRVILLFLKMQRVCLNQTYPWNILSDLSVFSLCDFKFKQVTKYDTEDLQKVHSLCFQLMWYLKKKDNCVRFLLLNIGYWVIHLMNWAQTYVLGLMMTTRLSIWLP